MRDLKEKIRNLSPEQKELLLKKIHRSKKNLKQLKSNNKFDIVKADRDEQMPLSVLQEQLWFLDQLGGSKAYLFQMHIPFWGEVDISAIKMSLEKIISRHEILRTVFRNDTGQPQQIIRPSIDLNLSFIDLETLIETDHLKEYFFCMKNGLDEEFDLETGPLFSARIIRFTKRINILLVTIHHIIFDVWSKEVFERELITIYENITNNQSLSLNELDIQYVDYSYWQRKWLESDTYERQLNYWKEYLSGIPDVITLPLDHKRPLMNTFNGSILNFEIERALTKKIHQLSVETGNTLYMTLIAAFSILLSRYSGQYDIVIGSPVANRRSDKTKPLIGYFINTIAQRLRVQPGETFQTLMEKVQHVVLNGLTHQDLPFEKLVESLKPKRNLSYNPIFQVLFSLQNVSTRLPSLFENYSQNSNGNDAPYPREMETYKDLLNSHVMPEIKTNGSQFDLSLNIEEDSGRLLGSFEYNIDLFDASTIDRMVSGYKVLLKEIVQKSNSDISHLPVLGKKELDRQLTDWNQTTREYPYDQCIHELFEIQSKKTPDRVALVYKEKMLTYRQLNNLSNQLAHFLIAKGVRRNHLVGLCVERSIEMVIGLLGILKSGGAYVPLDPSYPKDRIQYMIEDSQQKEFITQRSIAENFGFNNDKNGPDGSEGPHPIFIDELITSDTLNSYPISNPNAGATEKSAENLAYVIYTSGSTGKPKGVQIIQRGVCNFLFAMQDLIEAGEKDKFIALTSLSFDIAVLEIFLPLILGVPIIICSEKDKIDGERIEALIRRHFISIMQATPSTWQLMISSRWKFDGYQFKALCGGEPLSKHLAKRLLESGVSLYNLYGPTETTVWSTAKIITSATDDILIGKPINNTTVYILDTQNQMTPIGVRGELHIGGDGLAAGYLNRPNLTNEKFIKDDFSKERGARLYKTGDIVRYRQNGELECLGRVDDQVKIRGFRIEMGEIEECIREYHLVKNAVVKKIEYNSDARIIAYILKKDDDNSSGKGRSSFEDNEIISRLQSYLKNKLPGYMMPSFFMCLDNFPLTPNGKVDKKKLPPPNRNQQTSSNYVPPGTDLEIQISKIWSEILGIDNIGIEDDFFELGGHSLLATRVVAFIRRSLHIELPLRLLFSNSTIKAMAEAIEEGQYNTLEAKEIFSVPRTSDLPLSFAQQRLWFLDQMGGVGGAYNMPAAMRITGNLDLDVLNKALSEIIRRHESLRTTFKTFDGKAVQVINEPALFEFDVVDLQHMADAVQMEETIKLAMAEAVMPFDLEKDLMIRGKVLALGENNQCLFVTLHHIASDGWSIPILMNELTVLYEAFKTGQPSPLPKLSIQYADFSIWQRQSLSGDVLQNQIKYWWKQLDGIPDVHNLPLDYPRPAVQSYQGAVYNHVMENSIQEKLNLLCQEQRVTLFMALQSAFAVLLARYSNERDIVMGSPIANRTLAEIEPLIGFFVNTLVLRTRIEGNPYFRDLLKQTKETALEAYAHQAIPFEHVVEELQPNRSLSHQPLFQIAFALQNNEQVNISTANTSSLEITQIVPPATTTKFDLHLFVWETEMGLTTAWEYSTDLFEEATIRRMTEHFEMLLNGIVEDPLQRIYDIPLLDEKETHQLLYDWNDTHVDYPKDKCLQDLFEEQVSETPEAPAVVFNDIELSYGELEKRSNQLARYLQTLGVGPEVLVGIFMERSIEMVVAIYGILKAGGAYVPMDPEYPADRIAYMMEDAKAPVLLTQSHLKKNIDDSKSSVLCLDTQWGPISKESGNKPARHTGPDTLAYVIYTSGSTGRPKGVMNMHGGICNRLLWMQDAYQLTNKDVVLQKTPFSFDVSVWEFFWPLQVGARLVVAPPGSHREPLSLINIIKREEITTLHFVPSMLQAFLDEDHIEECESIKRVICSGEALPYQLQEIFFERLTAQLHNLYGPTEAAVDVTYWECKKGSKKLTVPIGRPVSNTQLYVLDALLEPVPVGVPGELHIGGVQVARGYLNAKELTSEKFIKNPFSDDPKFRLYKTGDLVRYLPDGNLEFLGRLDHQVKIRGFRIELGEIEAILEAQSVLKQATVLAYESRENEKSIAAYVVLDEEKISALAKMNEDGNDHVETWEAIFNNIYGEYKEKTSETNFIGWNSSYTGLPIPIEEMEEWLNHTIERIAFCHPGNVLEIGCGTGLLLTRIAPQCIQYTGTDFSSSALEGVAGLIEANETLSHVKLIQGPADDFAMIEEDSFDTIILNSVIQYFPSMGYLDDVLEKAIHHFDENGSIFIGDVRHYHLHRTCHLEVEYIKGQGQVDWKQLKLRTDMACRQEEELLISPSYFTDLKTRYPEITEVRVLVKPGKYHNELSRYRYDVIIRISDKDPVIEKIEPKWMSFPQDVSDITELQAFIESEDSECMAITSVPNARLSRANNLLWKMHQSSEASGNAKVKADNLATESESLKGFAFGIDPDALYRFAGRKKYQISLSWASSDPYGNYDLLIYKGAQTQIRFGLENQTKNHSGQNHRNLKPVYSNNPNTGSFYKKIVPLLRKALGSQLPDYMIPSAFVLLDELPLSPNGKIDRKSLPIPDIEDQIDKAYVAPHTQMEKELSEIWSDVLGLKKVGMHDNFFSIGGDSIITIQVVSRARKAGINITPRDLFENPTVAELARHAMHHKTVIDAPQEAVTGKMPLLPIQHWYFQSQKEDLHHFNQAVMIPVPVLLSKDQLEKLLYSLYERHDALRLKFTQADGNWQAIHQPLTEKMVLSSLESENLRDLDPKEQNTLISSSAEAAQDSLDLGKGPLLKAVWYPCAADSGQLLVVVHHLVVDGVSWQILLEDLYAGYKQLLSGKEIRLPEKTSSYQKWAKHLEVYAHSEDLLSEKPFWLDILKTSTDVFPEDHTPEDYSASTTRVVTVTLNDQETHALLKNCHSAYNTRIDDLLLVALLKAINAWCGVSKFFVDMESHGRESLFERVDTSQTIGWFTSKYPVLLSMIHRHDRTLKADNLSEQIKAIKEQLRAVPNNGIGFGILNYLTHDKEIKKASASNPTPVLFNYFGQTDNIFQTGDLDNNSGEKTVLANIGTTQSLNQNRTHQLGFNGIVSSGQLHFNIDYNSKQYRTDTIENLGQFLTKALKDLIAHCQVPGVGSYTPSDFPLAQVSQVELDSLIAGYIDMVDLYPSTALQAGLIFQNAYSQGSGIYIEQLHYELKGSLDEKALHGAWRRLVERHEIFRTVFVPGSREAYNQVVLKSADIPWVKKDWQGHSSEDQKDLLQEYLKKDLHSDFDITHAPLMRTTLIRLDDTRYHFIWTFHHALLDGWCVPLVMKEITIMYHLLKKNKPINLQKPPSYKTYIQWLQAQDIQNARNYWVKELKDLNSSTSLMMDKKMLPNDPNGFIDEFEKEMSISLTQKIKECAINLNVTINTLMQAAWGIVLNRYSGDETVLFGTAVSGRPALLPDVEEMLGLFINTIPVRIDYNGGQTINQFAASLNIRQQEREKFCYISLVDIQKCSTIPAGNQLFESLLVYENYPVNTVFDHDFFQDIESDASIELEKAVYQEHTNYPLTIVISLQESFTLRAGFYPQRFKKKMIKQILNHFISVLELLAALSPKEQLKNISILTETEKEEILHKWNNTGKDFPEKSLIHELFEKQVVSTPNAPAVVYKERYFTFRELNNRANQLAHFLNDKGIKPDSLVGICMDRSIEMIVGVFGTLKAGGAYVPIDSNSPQERIEYILEDASISCLLTQSHLFGRDDSQIEEGATEIVCLDSHQNEQILGQYSGENPLITGLHPENIAYGIYTSGSTGLPKGVLINHKGLINTVCASIDQFVISEESRFLQFASFGFDAATWEITMALLAGATLYMVPKAFIDNPSKLQEYINEVGISHMFLPPAMLNYFDVDYFKGIETLIVGGDKCSRKNAIKWSKNKRFFNAYGPSEVSICTSLASITPETKDITIGRPIQNIEYYVLDPQLNPVGIGIPGELYIGGAGLAKCYLNRDVLTREKFVNHPFSSNPESKLYRTGDLVRYQFDGNLEFLERIDNQVKIRGFRIEPGEIEAVLLSNALVKDTVVIAKDLKTSGKSLIAYIVVDMNKGEDGSRDEKTITRVLKDYMKNKLPYYMIPTLFVLLDDLPLNTSGKVNRKALPVPELDQNNKKTYIAPEKMSQQLMTNIWGKILKIEKISIKDNFFELGGHSLLATQIVSRIREVFSIELSLHVLFEYPTIEELSDQMELLEKENQVSIPTILPISGQENLPLSFAQERLWFFDQFVPNNPIYNISTAINISGPIHFRALEKSLNTVCKRHVILRTNFIAMDGNPVQTIRPEIRLALPVVDLHEINQEHKLSEIQNIVNQESQYLFQLEIDDLLRFKLISIEKGEYLAILTMHHIISDGWSMRLFLHEVMTLYEAFSKGDSSYTLPHLPVQYKDFALWQKKWLSGEILEHQLSYWKKQLKKPLPVLDDFTDYPYPEVQDYSGLEEKVLLDTDITSAIIKLNVESGTTLFMVILGAFATLVSRQTGQTDIIIGAPVANRNRKEIEKLIGFFVNVLVLRIDLSGDVSFSDLLKRVRKVCLDAFAHQDIPFEKLVKELEPERNIKRNPLFDIMFNFDVTTDPNLSENEASFSEQNSETLSKFAMTLYVNQFKDKIGLRLVYQKRLFSEARIKSFMEQFTHLLEQIAEHPDNPIDSFSLLTPCSKEILPDPNEILPEPSYKPVTRLIELWADKTPDHIALSHGDLRLTYADLMRNMKDVANILQTEGLKKGEVVALFLPKSIGLIVGMTGTLLGGGVLLLIDQDLPVMRRQVMVEEARAKYIIYSDSITREDNETIFQSLKGVKIDASTGTPVHKAYDISKKPDLPELTPKDAAYIFYTSGTTGIPKGILGLHKGISHFLDWQRNTFKITPGDRSGQLTGLSFDVVIRDIILPLSSGSTLCLPTDEALSEPKAVLTWLEKEKISVLHTVPSLTQSWLAHVPENITLTSLRLLFFAGEPLTRTIIDKWRQYFPKACEIINLYGPTETSLAKCFFKVPIKLRKEVQPIGFSLPSTQTLVLNANKELCGIREPGEIVIRTPYRSRGYINNPEENTSKFIKNPYGDDGDDVFYFTGDLGRYASDGSVEIMGRMDDQIKIRGIRIEPKEVEAVLINHPDILHVTVRAFEFKNEKRIFAYFVSNNDNLDSRKLYLYLQKRIPGYMIPSGLIKVGEIPLTPNGKVDKKSLPLPKRINANTDKLSLPPQTSTEEIIALIWSEILGVENMGIRDNFFELGGHSLLATQVISRIREIFSVEIPVRTLFEASTIEDLSIQVEKLKHKNDAVSKIEPATRDKAFPLSFAQERLWFLDQLVPENPFYNLQRNILIEGDLNVIALNQSLREIIKRHEVLRTNFDTLKGRPIQVFSSNNHIRLPFIDLKNLEREDKEREIQHLAQTEYFLPFDLREDQLIRAKLLLTGKEDQVLILTMHHIISDGWSRGIFARELLLLYKAFSKEKPSPLKNLPIQYADFSKWQRNFLTGDVLEKQLNFWKKQLGEAMNETLELPTDFPRPAIQSFTGGSQPIQIHSDLKKRISDLGKDLCATPFMILYTAFAALLYRYTGQENITIGTPLANRNRPEIEGLIGFFANTIVLRTQFTKNPSFREIIKSVREMMISTYDHQDLPFEKLVEELHPKRDLSRNPLIQVIFVFQNQPTQSLLNESDLSDIKVETIDFESATARLDLEVYLGDTVDGFGGSFVYNKDLFRSTTIHRLMHHFKHLLESAVIDPDQRVSDIVFLSGREKNQLLTEWNRTLKKNTHRDRCLHHIVEQKANETPDAIALVCEDQRISYGELNLRSNQLANYLKRSGVKVESPVGILMERSIEMIVGLLGILKAGGSYVPLDPTYPKKRLSFILEDSQAKVVVTHSSVSDLNEIFIGNASLVVPLDREWDLIAKEETGNLKTTLSPQNLAYTIYTSGSTGKPKGVQVNHFSVTNLFEAINPDLTITREDIWTVFHSFGFDLSVWEIWGPLFSGGQLVIVPFSMTRDAHDFFDHLKDEQVTVLSQTPSFMRQLIQVSPTGKSDGESDEQKKFPPHLRHIVCGGEALPQNLASEIMEEGVTVWNFYGPTEATVWTAIKKIEAETLTANAVSIGQPIANTHIHILDSNFQPSPIGVYGELFIGGDCLARGYLNRPELTKEKFVPHPFSEQSGTRLYRTGDLARYQENGDIEFLGRADFQVKVRGYRIELGEIENGLSGHPNITEAVAVTKEVTGADKQIVAYYVTSNGQDPSTSELRGFLKKKLPEYMIPHYFVVLPNIPLMPSGKIDRKKLPEPNKSIPLKRYVAPRTSTEEVVASIWAEVLGLEKVGIDDDFFELGGHSLLATQVVSRLSDSFRLHLQVRLIFEYPNIRDLGNYIEFVRQSIEKVMKPTDTITKEQEEVIF